MCNSTLTMGQSFPDSDVCAGASTTYVIPTGACVSGGGSSPKYWLKTNCPPVTIKSNGNVVGLGVFSCIGSFIVSMLI